jgi:hypothetical protein
MAAAMTTIDTIHIPNSQITAGTIHLAAIMIGPSRRLLHRRKVTIRLCPMILVITAVAGPTKSTRQPGYWTAALARMANSVTFVIGLSLPLEYWVIFNELLQIASSNLYPPQF